MPAVELNPGAQYDFVMNDHRHSGYFGGRGAGKTVALVARALRFAHQPQVPGEGPPRGVLLTDSFPHLKDIVYPVMYMVLNNAGIKYREVKNQSDRKFILLPGQGKVGHGSEILMRSLDQPDRVRGLTTAWFGVDEGREFDSDYAYRLLVGTMRQGRHPDDEIDEQGIWIPGENYKHAGWVVSTPSGFDWQYWRFHPDSDKRSADTAWYSAPTHENRRHLPARFIKDLETDYEGLFYQQEVLGEFVGAIGGAVWPMFHPNKHTDIFEYDPDLPLYAGWDFGIGDASVCIFAQVAYTHKVLPDGSVVDVPQLRLLDALEHSGMTVAEFASEYWRWCDTHTGGRTPAQMWGDPAGMQRNQVTGTSTIAAFSEHGIYITPTPKAPLDQGIIIVQNLMERPGGFLVNRDNMRLQQAIQTWHFKTSDDGIKESKEPVHDWTSHFCTALTYLVRGGIGLHPTHRGVERPGPTPGTMDYVMDQLLDSRADDRWMGDDTDPVIRWHPDEQVGLEGLF